MTRSLIRGAGVLASGLLAVVLSLPPGGGDLLATVPAVPVDRGATAPVRDASATVFRPAPMPDEDLNPWPTIGGGGATDARLAPEVLAMHNQPSGSDVLASTSSEYDHQARVRPAGGVGLTIPMP